MGLRYFHDLAWFVGFIFRMDCVDFFELLFFLLYALGPFFFLRTRFTIVPPLFFHFSYSDVPVFLRACVFNSHRLRPWLPPQAFLLRLLCFVVVFSKIFGNFYFSHFFWG